MAVNHAPIMHSSQTSNKELFTFKLEITYNM